MLVLPDQALINMGEKRVVFVEIGIMRIERHQLQLCPDTQFLRHHRCCGETGGEHRRECQRQQRRPEFTYELHYVVPFFFVYSAFLQCDEELSRRTHHPFRDTLQWRRWLGIPNYELHTL
ncbi:hypothetical protein D3C71_1534980 [compost metagenome]